MKMMKMIYPLAIALVLAATGCKHQPVGVTQLKPGPVPPPTDYERGTKSDNTGGGPLLPNEINPTSTSGIQQANPSSFDGMTEDRNALANYTAHFKYDSAAVQKSDKANLQAVADALAKDKSLKLLIEGNCDERGTDEYNRALGERRALALREALAKIGVDPSRVRTISLGKDKPADPGHDESAWAKNRRGDFILLLPNPNGTAGTPKGRASTTTFFTWTAASLTSGIRAGTRCSRTIFSTVPTSIRPPMRTPAPTVRRSPGRVAAATDLNR